MAREDKRKAILQSAVALFRNKRFHEVTLDEVAASAHVGKGTIYLYFENKEDLFFQMVVEGFRALEGALREIAATEKPLREKLCAIAEAMSDEFRRHHALFRVIHSKGLMKKRPGAKAIFHNHMTSLHEVLERVFREGVEDGTLRRDLDVSAACSLFVGSIHERDMRALHAGKDVSVETVIDLILTGCQPHA